MQIMPMGRALPNRPPEHRPYCLKFDGTDGAAEKHYTSKVEQEHRDGTQIDTILKKHGTTGMDPRTIGLLRGQVAEMPYGVQPDKDYQTQLNKIVYIKTYFERLPSGLRDRFNNSPAEMLHFMSDPKNAQACREIGLFAPIPEAPGSAREPEKKPSDTTSTPLASKTESAKI